MKAGEWSPTFKYVSTSPRAGLIEKGWRESLGWIRQEDGYSCGLLATLAAVIVLQGFQPDLRNVGIDRHLLWSGHGEGTAAALAAVRDTLWMLVVDDVVSIDDRLFMPVWFQKIGLAKEYNVFSDYFDRPMNGKHWRAVSNTGLRMLDRR